jgi:hypothetical protein
MASDAWPVHRCTGHFFGKQSADRSISSAALLRSRDALDGEYWLLSHLRGLR